MYYSKISCNINDSMTKVRKHMKKVIPDLDYSAIVTVTDYGKIIIEGSESYQVDEEQFNLCIEYIFLEDYKAILTLEKASQLEGIYGDEHYHFVVAPIRYYDNYYVFAVYSRLNKVFTESEVNTMEYLTDISYENIVLNHEIIRERNYLQSIFNSTKSYIFTFDLNGKVISLNRKAAKIFNVGEEIVGGKMDKYCPKDLYAKYKLIYDSVLESKKSKTGEEIFISLDEKKYFVNYTMSPMFDRNENIFGIVLMVLDVSKQKIYEREVEQLRQYALLSQASAEIAHDIKNPLMGIRGCAELLQRKIDEELSDSYIEPIISEVDRISEKINMLLSYSKMHAENNFMYIDMNSLIDTCINNISFYRSLKFIKFIKNYDDDLPHIKGAERRMAQCIFNILLNAFNAIDSQGEISINTQTLHEEHMILVEIIDNGVGISDENLKRIREPFFTTKENGTGLGLSIVANVVKELKGTFEIESTLGIGTVMRLKMPYEDGR